MEAKTKTPYRRPKQIPAVVRFALSHALRIELLILMHQGLETCAELAEATGKTDNNVGNHLRKMWEEGAIEVARSEEFRGTTRYYYRPVELPIVTQEEAEALTEVERHLISGVVVLSALAEILAGLEERKLADPRTVAWWAWSNVDDEGEKDIEEEHKRHLERLDQIKVDSANRLAASKEPSKSMLSVSFAFERSRPAPER